MDQIYQDRKVERQPPESATMTTSCSTPTPLGPPAAAGGMAHRFFSVLRPAVLASVSLEELYAGLMARSVTPCWLITGLFRVEVIDCDRLCQTFGEYAVASAGISAPRDLMIALRPLVRPDAVTHNTDDFRTSRG